ncbi:FecCD family ABC transporter permease [Corynebacterium otitidis]|uniref:FecCD family ABC transporter permease n=1 Tax=Corynebacterium otitidis TaxID=29321 RepID=UPI000627C597|nr:iron ABC transporter permease [Corynebacterium otitidis]KKO84136.1 iron ABC transporter permease [Corynebacterium otitidis]
MPTTAATTAPAPSTRLRRRRLFGLAGVAALLAAGLVASLVLGARDVPLSTALEAIPRLRAILADPDAFGPDEQVIAELRLPRTLLAVVVGAALGAAGALIQGHTRNPLADPGIIGISSGAALAVVAGFAFLGIATPLPSAAVAFGGAIAATAAVFALASIGRGVVNPLTLVLGGAALSAVLSSVTAGLVLTDSQNLDRMRFWTVGSVAGRDLDVVWAIAPLVALGLVAALATGPTLNVLNLGEDAAAALGVNTGRHRVAGMLIIALLAGAATAAAGPIGFVGLLVPHLARGLCGPDYRWILPYSAAWGAALLLIADVAARLVARPGELQVGIVLAFVGAPFFLYLLYRGKVGTV